VIHRLKEDEEQTLMGIRPSLLALSPDGSRVAVAIRLPKPAESEERSRVEVWDTRSRRRIWDQVVEPVYRLNFAPDSRTLAASTGSHVYQWAADGQAVTPLEIGDMYVVDWDPEGRLVVNDEENRLLLLGPTLSMKGAHRDYPHQACFLKNREAIVSTGHDHTVRFWDIQSGREKATLELGATEIFWLGCAADGTVTGASTNGKVVQWSTELLNEPVSMLQMTLRLAHAQELAPQWTSLEP
jgi:WD40 repeat protein